MTTIIAVIQVPIYLPDTGFNPDINGMQDITCLAIKGDALPLEANGHEAFIFFILSTSCV